MKSPYDRTYDRARIARERERAQFETDQQREAEERKAENAAARARYLASLEAAKAAKRKEHDAEIDAELEPTKIRLRRQWLVDHPGETEKSFEKKAWPLLRANLLTEREAAGQEATRQSMLRSGQYGL